MIYKRNRKPKLNEEYGAKREVSSIPHARYRNFMKHVKV